MGTIVREIPLKKCFMMREMIHDVNLVFILKNMIVQTLLSRTVLVNVRFHWEH